MPLATLFLLPVIATAYILHPSRYVRPSALKMVDTIDSAAEQYKQIRAAVLTKINSYEATGEQQKAFIQIFSDFLDGYCDSCLLAGESPETFKISIFTLLKFVQQGSTDPFKFEPYHKAIRAPFDYYTWGNNFMRPLIIDEQSKLVGVENFQRIRELIAKGDNVVILSNHQTEADAQVFSILLEREGMSDLGEQSIFIAGHKVTNDPIAIPFSMGRNLICIHSKKHIKNPPEDFTRKSAENLKSMTVRWMVCLCSKYTHDE